MKFGSFEQGVPIPKRSKYPFDEMDVGDCVLIEWDQYDAPTQYNAIKRALYRDANKKYIMRSARGKDGERLAVRVWRTE